MRSMTEGLLQYNVRISPKAKADTIPFTAQSLRVALRRPSFLYTRLSGRCRKAVYGRLVHRRGFGAVRIGKLLQ